jgi:plasmid stability protein
MPSILVRGVDTKTIEKLKARAKQNGRSLQNEVKTILEREAGLSWAEVRAMAEQSQKELAGRKFADSADLLREDRNR